MPPGKQNLPFDFESYIGGSASHVSRDGSFLHQVAFLEGAVVDKKTNASMIICIPA